MSAPSHNLSDLLPEVVFQGPEIQLRAISLISCGTGRSFKRSFFCREKAIRNVVGGT